MTTPARRRPRRELTFGAAIALPAVVLIALTWQFTASSVANARRASLEDAERDVANLALGVEWQLNRQLQAIDQMLQLLAEQFTIDPIHLDPVAWARRSPILGDFPLQVLVLNERGVVTAATSQDAVGLDLSGRAFFSEQRDSRSTGVPVGPATRWREAWKIHLSRRLENTDGSFAGALVGIYDPWTLTNSLEQIDLRPGGMIALVSDDGAIRTLVASANMPADRNVRDSAMFGAVEDRQYGVWTGRSAPDGVERVHAFRRLSDQDLAIVIGFDRAVLMGGAESWATTAYWFAGGITVAIIVLAGLLLRALGAARSREDRLARDRTALAAAYTDAETAKGQAEAKTAQLEGVISGMSDGVMLLDAELRLVLWNQHFPRCTGVRESLLRVGVPIKELLRAQALDGEFGAGPRADPEPEVARRMVPLRARQDYQAQRTRPSGRTVELRCTALQGGGYLSLYTDITARRQTEEARDEARRIAHEITDQKASLVAVVSHEIRTPLNALVGSLALLDRSGLSAAQQRLTNTARQAGEALLALVNDILEMSKMEAGQLGLLNGPFEVAALLEGVAGMFQADAAARGIDLVVQLAPDLPPQLSADSGRLRQVLMNFVSNATKFAAPGTVTIRACATLVAGQPSLLLGVADHGPRIPEREAALLFLPFSRLAGARASGMPGTGLGLAICERLIRLMGGQIGIGPSPEGGNEFWATVPLEPVAHASPGPRLRPPSSLRRSSRQAVLLVEDVPANQLVTAIALRRAGHRVDVAESGAEALHLVQCHSYDLVLMDLVMPGMGGEEAARQIRRLPGPAGRVPIVALTATTAPADRSRCEAAGMDAVLAKPVRPEALLAVVETGTRGYPDSRAATAVAERVDAIDRVQLAELQRSFPPAKLLSLIEQCVADIAGRLARLREALESGEAATDDAERAAEAAHALAGMAASYGLAGLERLMRQIMAAAQAGHFAEAAQAVRQAEAELPGVAADIHAVLRPIAA